MVNISGLVENSDRNYRYRRPTIELEPSRGFIHFQNLREIAEALNRPPEMVSKFFELKLSASMKLKDGRYLMKTKADATAIELLIREFTEHLVLCPKCRLPETTLDRGKHSCAACGTVSPVDIANRAVEKALKTESKSGKREKKGKRDKREKREREKVIDPPPVEKPAKPTFFL